MWRGKKYSQYVWYHRQEEFLSKLLSTKQVILSMTRTHFFANRTLALKETRNSTKHPKKNKYYNEILEKPFIFNLQTMSTARRRFRSFPSRPYVDGCGREVAERVKKTTSVPKTKKKEELPMKRAEAGETLLQEEPPPPPERRLYKP
jgi:hypothetical protein